MPELALALWAAFFLLAIVGRAALQYRLTGSSGLIGITAAAGSLEWLGGLVFGGAIAAGVAAPVLDLNDVVAPYDDLDSTGVHVAGIVVFALGFAGLIASQLAMGASWRVGVDESERTELVTTGLFSVVRNPIYTAMIAAFTGLALLVPGPISFGSVALLVVALEMQTRLVEEPYLRRVHGRRYEEYAARVGRFLPGIGLVSILLATLIVAAGCGDDDAGSGDPAPPAEGTDLEVTVWPQGRPGSAQSAEVRCAGGDSAHCEAAAAVSAAALQPVPPGTACTQIYGGPEKARIAGTLEGEPVDVALSRSDGCQIDRWDAALPLLELAER